MIAFTYLMEKIDFPHWLRSELEKRNLNQADLARLTRISATQIGRIFSGERGMGLETAVSIANALKVSPMTVIRKAGFIPNNGEETKFEDWQYLLNQLTPTEQEEMRQFIELKIDLRQKNEGLKSLKPKKAGK